MQPVSTKSLSSSRAGFVLIQLSVCSAAEIFCFLRATHTYLLLTAVSVPLTCFISFGTTVFITRCPFVTKAMFLKITQHQCLQCRLFIFLKGDTAAVNHSFHGCAVRPLLVRLQTHPYSLCRFSCCSLPSSCSSTRRLLQVGRSIRTSYRSECCTEQQTCFFFLLTYNDHN